MHKLQSLDAHIGKTNCVHIGRNTGALLVTGGDDALVNVWAVGRPGVIFSLQGHSSPVTSVRYDRKEESVLSGARNGTIKLFDLEKAKQIRTATGHRAEISAIDVHALGNWFASGSVDTNWKLWDKRQKGCTATFKGHSVGISHILFSPPGTWVVTAASDGLVKVWDLAAGKAIADLSHTHAVTAVNFSPTELVLATACKDRTIRLWDLDSFEAFDQCGPETTSATALGYTSDGGSLFAAFPDSFRQYSLEPAACVQSRLMSWSPATDLMVSTSSIICCSLAGTSVAVWAGDTQSQAQEQKSSPPASSPLRQHNNVATGAQRNQPASDNGQQVNEGIQAAAAQLEKELKVSEPTHATWRKGQEVELQPAVVNSADDGDDSGAQETPPSSNPGCEAPPGAPLRPVITDPQKSMQDATLPPKPGMAHISTDIGESLLRGQVDAAQDPPARPARVSCPEAPVYRAAPPAGHGRPRSGSHSSGGEARRHPFREPRSGDPRGDPRRDARAAARDRGMSPLAPAPRDSPGRASPDSGGKGAMSLAELSQAIHRKHREFKEGIATRESQLGIVRGFWEKGDVRGCMAAVQRSADPVLAVDVFRFMRARGRAQHFRLNMCVPAAAAVRMCLRGQPDSVANMGLIFLELVLKGFAGDIRTGCAYVEQERGPVDIKGDERRELCREARDAFVDLLPGIRVIAAGEGGQPRALRERATRAAELIDRIDR